MKKILSVIIALTMCMFICACDNVSMVGGYDGQSEICVYSDSSLAQKHDGDLEVGKTYYVSFNVEIEKIYGVATDKIGYDLRFEFPYSDNIIVELSTGGTMTSLIEKGTLVYSLKSSVETTYNFVFNLTLLDDSLFNINVLVDDKLIGERLINA